LESTCWRNDPPPGQKSEIIEIGVCIIDMEELKVKTTIGIPVRPAYSKVSDFCTGLTGWTDEKLQGAATFQEAVTTLKNDFKSKQHTWASWGDYDRVQFERCCELHKVGYPFGRRHISLKTLFAIMCGLQDEVSVAGALEILGWEFEGCPHRGVDDAENIARIFTRMLEWSRDGRAAEILDPDKMSAEQVSKLILAEGGDPDRLGKNGVAVVNAALKRLKTVTGLRSIYEELVKLADQVKGVMNDEAKTNATNS